MFWFQSEIHLGSSAYSVVPKVVTLFSLRFSGIFLYFFFLANPIFVIKKYRKLILVNGGKSRCNQPKSCLEKLQKSKIGLTCIISSATLCKSSFIFLLFVIFIYYWHCLLYKKGNVSHLYENFSLQLYEVLLETDSESWQNWQVKLKACTTTCP